MNKRDSQYVNRLLAAQRAGEADAATLARALAAMHRAAGPRVQRELCEVIAGAPGVADLVDFRPAALGGGMVMIALC